MREEKEEGDLHVYNFVLYRMRYAAVVWCRVCRSARINHVLYNIYSHIRGLLFSSQEGSALRMRGIKGAVLLGTGTATVTAAAAVAALTEA